MSEKTKQPDWQKWGETKFLSWYDRNPDQGIDPPNDRTKEGWQTWGENVYTPWYNTRVETQDDSGSNPGGTPPPPPGTRP